MAKSREEVLATARAWKEKNKERVKAKRQEYYALNKEKEKTNNEKWLTENKEYWQEKKAECNKNWIARNKDSWSAKRKTDAYHKKENDRKRERYASDQSYRAMAKLRAAMYQAFKLQGIRKHSRSQTLLGTPINEVRAYLEKMFVGDMNWDNVHIDHIRPCASFDLSRLEDARECFHYTNLQPLFAKDNLQKSSRYNGVYYRNEKEICNGKGI